MTGVQTCALPISSLENKNTKQQKAVSCFHGAEDETCAYCYAIRLLRGKAARTLAKNMPQAYFINARADRVQVL